MNYDGVPDDHFDETEHDYADINPMSSGFSSHKAAAAAAAANENDEIMELLWQNGQLTVQKSSKRVIPAEQPVLREIRSPEEQQHLFMQEDEMASWLHYPVLDDSSNFSRDFYGTTTDLFYSTQPPTASTAAGAEIRQPLQVPPRQPIPPPPAPEISSPTQLQNNFLHFSRLPSKPITSKPSTDLTVVVESSNDNPMAGKESSVPYSTADDCRRRQANTEGVTARELANSVTCELTAPTSSPSGSGTSFSASAEARPLTPKQDPPPAADVATDGKRKERETDDNEYRNEDIEFEVNRQAGRTASASTKRSRAAEVHNQSERRRRDRINEKMKALQELIPRCNKSDKASMLDEAIEYLKSLQMQVQMMSMGCGGMVPMMYPGMQQYMPAMGMGMGMGMNQTMLPYPSSMLQVPPAGSATPNPAAHIGPRTPIPGFHMPHHHTRIQPSNHHDLMINSLLSHNANHPPMQNLVDPYHQFGQLPIPQNQAMMQHNIKPSISKEVGDPENKQSGRK